MTDKRNTGSSRLNYVLGATVAGGLALGATTAQADADPFRVADLGSGYMVAANQAEGQCAGMATGEEKGQEGNCAGMEGMSGSDEGHAEGADKDKAADKKSGEGKCGEGKCANS